MEKASGITINGGYLGDGIWVMALITVGDCAQWRVVRANDKIS